MPGPERILTGETLISTLLPPAFVLVFVVVFAVVFFVVVFAVVVLAVVLFVVVFAVVLSAFVVLSSELFASRQNGLLTQPVLLPSRATLYHVEPPVTFFFPSSRKESPFFARKITLYLVPAPERILTGVAFITTVSDFAADVVLFTVVLFAVEILAAVLPFAAFFVAGEATVFPVVVVLSSDSLRMRQQELKIHPSLLSGRAIRLHS